MSMKKKINQDGTVELEGTPEELSDYDKKVKNGDKSESSSSKTKKKVING